MRKLKMKLKYDVKALHKFPKGVWPTADVYAEYRGIDKEDAIKLSKRLKEQGYNVIVTELKIVTL